jgi:hypothetical protein
VLLVTGIAVGACAPAEPESTQEPTVDTLAVGEESRLPDGQQQSPDDPFFGFDLDRTVAATTKQREVALRLVNEGLEDVLVFADAGAGEVMVDSISAGDWTRVDLVTRAQAVTLKSTDLRGRILRRVEITVGLDSVRQVIVSAP